MNWTRISLLLCVFGFVKEFRPSEPFVVEYLTGPWKNFTEEQVYQDLVPLYTYYYSVTLLPILLLTDFLRYKPIIILCGLSGTCSYIAIVLSKGVQDVQIISFLLGVFMSSEVAYFSYIYAKVSKLHYQEVTSHTRMALLLGRFTAGITSQLTVSTNLLDYHQLNYVSLLALGIATIWSFFLPPLGQSVYLHRPIGSVSNEPAPSKIDIGSPNQTERSSDQLFNLQQGTSLNNIEKEPSLAKKIKHVYYLLWKDFLLAYSNSYVLKWSLWWTLSTCGFMQVINYVQVLWQSSFEEAAKVYNGAVEAALTIMGALASFGVGKLKLNWPIIGEGTSSIIALIQGILLFIAAQTHNIWISYTAYVIFSVAYQAMITVASSEIAKHLSEDSYGLIFGMNTLVALLEQSLLTFLISGSQVFGLAVRPQYVVYGCYFVVLSVIFMIMAVHTLVKHRRSNKQFNLWESRLSTP